MRIIEVKNLKKTYGQGLTAVNALKGIALEVRVGEFLAIMGRSGSGKSTLLHLLGLLDMPTHGEIFIDGKDVLKLSERERARFRLEEMGFIFQEYSLIGEMTILENVFLPALCLCHAIKSVGRPVKRSGSLSFGFNHKIFKLSPRIS